MSGEPDSLLFRMVREMRADIRNTLATTMASQDGLAELKSDIRADVASDMLVLRKDLSERIVGLRHAVVEDHTSVIGHGVITSGHDALLRRVEQHLDLLR